MQFENVEAAASAINRARIGLATTQTRAGAVAAEITAAFAAHGNLIARAAAGDEPAESEWQESETRLAQLGRLAERLTSILRLQAAVIDAVKSAGEGAGQVVQ
jgi:hypothetical protein